MPASHAIMYVVDCFTFFRIGLLVVGSGAPGDRKEVRAPGVLAGGCRSVEGLAQRRSSSDENPVRAGKRDRDGGDSRLRLLDPHPMVRAAGAPLLDGV